MKTGEDDEDDDDEEEVVVGVIVCELGETKFRS